MFTVKLGEKTYTVEKVTARALREMDEAWELYIKMDAASRGEADPSDSTTFAKAIDAMVRWFVIFCGEQFTADEVYDHYPADRIVTDVALAMSAVVGRVTEALSAFPTGEVAEKSPEDHTATSPTGSMTSTPRPAGRLMRWTKRTR